MQKEKRVSKTVKLKIENSAREAVNAHFSHVGRVQPALLLLKTSVPYFSLPGKTELVKS
jgi:hypothetical protein